MNFPRRFIFHGNATGVAARIRRPEYKLLPVHASSTVPTTGGSSESKTGPANLDDYLAFDSAETEAHGDYVDPDAALAMTHGTVGFDAVATKTVVTSKVRGLRVGRRFRVGVADAGLTSYSPEGESTQNGIRLSGNRLEDVTVDGYVLKITLNERLFSEHDTLDKLHAAHAKGLGAHAAMFYRPAGHSENKMFVSNGMAHATIVEKMEWEGRPHPNATIDGNFLYVPDFGRVYFGELFLSHSSRRLTMLRFQLGSPDGGDISVSDVEPNGSTWP